MKYKIRLVREILKNLRNNNLTQKKQSDQTAVSSNQKKVSKVLPIRLFNFLKANSIYFIGKYGQGFNYLYNILEDNESKELLLKIVAYRILGPLRVKLPLDTPDYYKNMNNLEKLFSKTDKIKDQDSNLDLRRIDLRSLGYPVDMYYEKISALTEFIIKQYEYKDIKIRAGDFVIDAGACWGDTALLFANEVGNQGKIFSFEFTPSNLAILNKNLELNSNLKNRIVVVSQPLWSENKKMFFHTNDGPASKILPTDIQGNEQNYEITTTTIDNYIKTNRIPKIDYIKMDIEGAELEALKGSINTLKEFKPRLAICLYHSLNDFIEIPRYLSKLNLGYKFYLKHSSTNHRETVMLATTD